MAREAVSLPSADDHLRPLSFGSPGLLVSGFGYRERRPPQTSRRHEPSGLARGSAARPVAAGSAAAPRHPRQGCKCDCDASHGVSSSARVALHTPSPTHRSAFGWLGRRKRPLGSKPAVQMKAGKCYPKKRLQAAARPDGPPTVLVLLSRCLRSQPCASTERKAEELTMPHSITSSARARSVGGIVMPSAFAVFRLITTSNVVGCSTGRSAGFVPFKILSTYVAARRTRSGSDSP